MITLTNITEIEIILIDRLFREAGSGQESYTIPNVDVSIWANDDSVISKIADGSMEFRLNGNLIPSISEAIDTLKGIAIKKVESTNQAFASKALTDGSKIFRRVRGIEGTVQNVPVNIDFVVPFAKCKITGLQILGAKLGDKATFQVLDTAQGTISGVPNGVLNTFGENVYVAEGLADYPSRYDADLIQGLTLRILYDAKDELLPRKVYINFDLHQII